MSFIGSPIISAGAGSSVNPEELVQTGMMIPNPASGVIPAGYLLCDGRAVSRTTYSALFAVIGIQHGSGDGSSTFNLPDPRGRGLMGSNHSDLPNGKDGTLSNRIPAEKIGDEEANHSHSVDGHSHSLAGHTHNVEPHAHPIADDGAHFHNAQGAPGGNNQVFTGVGSVGAIEGTADHNHLGTTGLSGGTVDTYGPSTANTGSSGSSTNSQSPSVVQPSLVVDWIIKT